MGRLGANTNVKTLRLGAPWDMAGEVSRNVPPCTAEGGVQSVAIPPSV